MAVKSSSVGLFTIPTAPSVGTNVATTAANTFSTVYVTLQASGSLGALFITDIGVTVTSSLKPTYCNVQIATGASGSESIVGQIQITGFNTPVAAAGITQGGRVPIWPAIPVAANVRIAAKVADSVSPLTWAVATQAILQANVVAEGSINETVNAIQVNGTNLTARDIGASVLLSSGAGTGQLDFTSGVVKANAVQLLGTAWLTPGTAGTPDVNAKLLGGTSQTGRDVGGAVPAVAAGSSGGLLISGSNAGTTTLGALTITGVTTQTGNVIYSDGITISAPSTGNRAGIDITGNGTGAAVKATGGATGQGLNIIGGGTSGDGIKVTTTSGHGINLAPVGSSMHGLLATGGNGGTSDGIKGAAGTGGVDIRGNITGNLVGTVSVLTTYTGNTVQTGDSFGRIGVAGAGLTALGDVRIANLDGTVTSRMATYTQPTGFLAATFPVTVASTTNITAGTVTTVSGNVTGSVGSVTGLTASNLDATVSSRLATVSYTAPDNTSVTAIKAKTDSLTFTTPGEIDSNIQSVNNTTVNGVGTTGSPWGP